LTCIDPVVRAEFFVMRSIVPRALPTHTVVFL